MRRARGFTLIELLVVITIIAILAAILFPVFAKAREKAGEPVACPACASSRRASSRTRQDYDERWVQTGWQFAASTLTTPRHASGRLRSIHTSRTSRSSCARASRRLACSPRRFKTRARPGQWWRQTYGISELGLGRHRCAGDKAMADAELVNPAEILLLADCRCHYIGGYWSVAWPGRAAATQYRWPAATLRGLTAHAALAAGTPRLTNCTCTTEAPTAFADGHARIPDRTRHQDHPGRRRSPLLPGRVVVAPGIRKGLYSRPTRGEVAMLPSPCYNTESSWS